MTSKKNRRNLDRIKIPDGSVYYKPDTQMYIFNRYIGPENLIDISKSGAGFKISHDLHKNDYVMLKVILPGEKNLTLQGHIKWVLNDNDDGKNRVGIQFSPYGYDRKYNSYDKLKQLGKLSVKYQ
jgi:hypothetical protein